MLKDPRLCVTLRTWIPLLNFIPAVVFTYRHPLDVALSMHKREGFAVARGLKMWYVYNRMSIQVSVNARIHLLKYSNLCQHIYMVFYLMTCIYILIQIHTSLLERLY